MSIQIARPADHDSVREPPKLATPRTLTEFVLILSKPMVDMSAVFWELSLVLGWML